MRTELIVSDDWDPMAPDNVVDPIRVNGEVREQCPVAHSSQFGGFWALFKRADIVAATKQTDVFVSSPAITVPPFSVADAPWVPLQSDPPQHRQYRRIVNRFFFASRLEGFKPTLRRLTDEFIDEFVKRGEADVVADPRARGGARAAAPAGAGRRDGARSVAVNRLSPPSRPIPAGPSADAVTGMSRGAHLDVHRSGCKDYSLSG